MNRLCLFLPAMAVLTLTACRSHVRIVVTNPSGVSRSGELAEVPLSRLGRAATQLEKGVSLTDGKGHTVPAQVTHDSLFVFPVSLGAGERAEFRLQPHAGGTDTISCGRVYPERLDDVAWENDKSAYRAYGPALQRSGERAYGYDIMVKRVSYPVLEQRYAHELDTAARRQIAAWRKSGQRRQADSLARAISYHVDHGNGMDCYDVGPTLGGGAAALWVDSAMVFPRSYRTCEILDNGPLRFSMRLTYEPRQAGRETGVVEQRVITLDAGSYLNRTEVTYAPLHEAQSVVAGIVIHRQNPDGYRYDRAQRYVAYADSTNNARAGNGVIYVGVVFADSLTWAGVTQEHVLGMTRYAPGRPLRYYWGSGWSKGGVESMDAWCSYLRRQAICREQPLRIEIKR